MFNFENLPAELVQLIFSYLSVKDRIKSAPTSKFFNAAANDDVFWKNLLTEIAGEHFQKSKEDTRSIQQICVETLEHLPICAQNFIDIITWTEAKESEFDKNDLEIWEVFELILKNVQEIPNILNVYSIVKYILKENPNFIKENHNSPYNEDFCIEHILAALSDAETFKLIMNYGGDLEIEGQGDSLPIHIAATYGQSKGIIQTLVNLKPDSLSAEDSLDRTPLEWAAIRYNHELLESLYSEELLTADNERPEAERLMDILFQRINRDLLGVESIFDPETFGLQIFYIINSRLLSAFHNNVPEADSKVKDNLPKQYNFLKTIDFFLKKGWEFPKWFNELINPVETAREAKHARFEY